MSNPVEGPGGPNQPPSLSPNQGGNPTDKRVDSVANEVFSTNPGASSLSASLSSRVSAGEVRPSKEDILKQWLESQPENAKTQAQQILDILQKKDLDNPFELDLRYLKNITSLPNVFQNCTRLYCSWCDSLQTLPELPACIELNCSGCRSLRALPELTSCTSLYCSGCTCLQTLPALPACTKLDCSSCSNFETLPALPAFIELNCSGCRSLRALPELTSCTSLCCSGCTRLQTLPALPACTKLDCSFCSNFETLPALPACIELTCYQCLSLRALPELTSCTSLCCSGCTRLQTLPELPVCKGLDCSNCPNLEAVLLLRDGFQVHCINSPKVVLFEFVDSAKCEIEGVRYLPKALPEELKVELTPPLPDSASIEHLKLDLETFIGGLKELDLRTLKKEIEGQEDLASYKQKLTEWKNLLFGRVQGGLGYPGTPPSGSKELKEFYEKIKYYLSHLDAFLSKEENRDAHIERLQILQTQSACGARFIAELEQLFSMNCIGGEIADLGNQFAQIASTEAKLAIERMYPEGNVHEINQAMFQLKDYLTGSYFKDQLASKMDQGELIIKFLKYHTSVNLVTTIQNCLKPNSPLEDLFTQYLKENFTPQLTKDILEELNKDVNKLWEDTKERKIAAFKAYDLVRQKPAQERTAQDKLQMAAQILSFDEKACEFKGQLDLLLESKEKSFKDKNIQSGEESEKVEILYQEHYDQEANRWKLEIIAKALQKMGILATEAELFPKANYPSF